MAIASDEFDFCYHEKAVLLEVAIGAARPLARKGATGVTKPTAHPWQEDVSIGHIAAQAFGNTKKI